MSKTTELPVDYSRPHQKSIDNPDLVTVLCPTRSRPDYLKSMISSLDNFAAVKELIDLWVLVDEDDRDTLALIETEWDTTIGINISWCVQKRPVTLADGLNSLWKKSSNGGIYVYISDHYRMMTPHWDVRLRDVFKTIPNDRFQVVQIEDELRESDDLIIWAISAEWANATGRFVPPYFPYWFIDMWIDHVATMVGRKVHAGIKVRPINEEAVGTHALWNLAYWMEYFHKLLFERVDEVDALLSAIYGPGTIDFEAAKTKAEMPMSHYEKWASTKIDQNKMSQIEQKYSGERNDPDARYLVAEEIARRYMDQMEPRIKKFTLARQLDLKQNLLKSSLGYE